MAQTLDLPVDVPWSLIAASPDMMDTGFADAGFPPSWRSSLAIYAYEPSASDLPPEFCDQKVTYLKVTCSITGYQPTPQEVSELNPDSPPPSGYIEDSLPNVAADVLEDLTDPYWGCYGVLLNVAVFPSTTTVPIDPPQPQDASFLDADTTFPDPYTDPLGLTFSLASGSPLTTNIVPPIGQFGLHVNMDTLQIDMPSPCTNVTIKVYIGNGNTRGTVRSYKDDAQLTEGVLPNAGPAVQEIPIITPSVITKIVIDVAAEEIDITEILFEGGERPTTIGDYPHIIDFEPKTRDLYQAATDQGEILTASTSNISAGKSLSNTSSSQMGIGLSGNVGQAAGQTGGLTWNVGGSLTGQWGNTTTDSSSTQIDQSRERRETQGTTTNITQQYNLLTGYHAGTNRATFLMLPRPHTLQATDYRTFVRGLRMIEGVQEFLLIVARPVVLPGICIEAFLETGHFPEDVHFAAPNVTKQTFVGITSFPVQAGGGTGVLGVGGSTTIPKTFQVPAGWTLDTSVSSVQWPETLVMPGVSYTMAPLGGSTTTSNDFLQAYGSVQPGQTPVTGSASGDVIQVTVTVSGSGAGGGFSGTYGPGGPAFNVPGDTAANAQFSFNVYATQPQSPPVDNEPVVASPFLITSRDLCACITSGTQSNCVMIAPPEQVPYSQGGAIANNVRVSSPAARGASRNADEMGASQRSSIVYEAKLKVPGHLLRGAQLEKSRTPAARELMHQVQNHMLTSSRRPQRRTHGSVGFVESDYVCERLANHLPEAHLSRPIGDVEGLSAGVVEAFGANTTVGDILKLELHRVRARARVGVEDAIRIRRKLLGLREQ
jgi:hypothetical protein